MIKSLPWSYHPAEHAAEHRLRHAVAGVLRGTSRMLSRLARRIAASKKARGADIGHLEFYAEAGAPEGAIYADGLLVGYVTGVKRL
jgi:hypothetical protein